MKFLPSFETLANLKNWFGGRSRRQGVVVVKIKDSPGATVTNNIIVYTSNSKGRGG